MAIVLNTIDEALDFVNSLDGNGLIVTDNELIEEALRDRDDLEEGEK